MYEKNAVNWKKNEFGIQLYKICVNWNDFILGIGAIHMRHEENKIILFSDPLENCPYATVKTYIIATVKISQTGLSN